MLYRSKLYVFQTYIQNKSVLYYGQPFVQNLAMHFFFHILNYRFMQIQPPYTEASDHLS